MQKTRLWITGGDGELGLTRTHSTRLMTVARFVALSNDTGILVLMVLLDMVL